MLNEWYKLRPKCAFLLVNSLSGMKKTALKRAFVWK